MPQRGQAAGEEVAMSADAPDAPKKTRNTRSWKTATTKAGDAMSMCLNPECGSGKPATVCDDCYDEQLRMRQTQRIERAEEVVRLTAKLAEVEAERNRFEEKLQATKHSCACEYDQRGDICMAHAPKIYTLEQQLDRCLAALAEDQAAFIRPLIIEEWNKLDEVLHPKGGADPMKLAQRILANRLRAAGMDDPDPLVSQQT